jgi:hypothetical protein
MKQPTDSTRTGPTPAGRRRINLFHGSYDPRPTSIWDLPAALSAIQRGTWQREIATLRRLVTQEGPARYTHAKKALDAFSFGGTFAPTRAKHHLTQHSGLAHYDYDHVDDLAAVRAVLCVVPSVVYVFASPSGTGLKVGLSIPLVDSDRAYKHAWQCGADFLEACTGVVADPSGKDICRLCYVSYDPHIALNLEAEVFTLPPPAAPARPADRAAAVPPGRPLPADRAAQYLQQALNRARHLIVSSVPPTATTPGTRHASRLKAARLVGGYVGGGFLSYDAAYATLEAVVQHHTDHLARSMRTIADGLHFGMRTPVTSAQLDRERQAWCVAHGYAPPQQKGA